MLRFIFTIIILFSTVCLRLNHILFYGKMEYTSCTVPAISNQQQQQRTSFVWYRFYRYCFIRNSNLAIAAKRLLLMRFIGGIRLFHFGFPLWTSNRNANLLSCLNFLKTRTKHSNDEPLIKFNSMNFSINVLCSVGEIKSHHQFVMKRLIIIELILIWIILIRLLTHSSFYFVAISNLIWQRKR